MYVVMFLELCIAPVPVIKITKLWLLFEQQLFSVVITGSNYVILKHTLHIGTLDPPEVTTKVVAVNGNTISIRKAIVMEITNADGIVVVVKKFLYTDSSSNH